MGAVLGSAAVATSLAGLGMAYASVRTARAVAGPWGLGPFAVPTVAMGLFTGVFLVVVCGVARAAGHLDAGLWAAAGVGLIWAVLAHRWPASKGRAAQPRTAWALGLVLVGLLALYGYIATQYQMHDEHAVFGHKSMVEQLRRGVYPLYFPSAPEQEARYHYGFDVMAGSLARAYDLSSDQAIDLLCLFFVLFIALGAAAVAADAGAESSAPLAAVAVHLGAGLAFVLLAGVPGRHPRCLAQYHHPSCEVELFPTQFLNVFQHPVSAGLPMFLVLVLLLPRLVRAVQPTSEDRRAYLGLALGCLLVLAGTSVAQFVYYALGALAALAAAPLWVWSGGKATLRGVIVLAAVVILSLGLAYLLGGMMAPNPSIDPTLVARRTELGFPEKTDLAGILYHHVVNLGLGFILLPIFALAALGRRRPTVVMLLAFSIGGILVAHLFTYLRSWDIVKFPSAASFALSLLYVIVVDRALAQCSFPFTWLRRAGVVLLLGSGLTAAAFVAVPLPKEVRLYEPGAWNGDALVAQTIDWWLSHDYQSKEVIYAQPNVARELSIFGGLSVVATDSDLYYIGIRMKELYRLKRQAQLIQTRMNAEALKALSVHYVMFSGEEERNLGAEAKRALLDPARFELVATFEGQPADRTRRIWRVK